MCFPKISSYSDDAYLYSSIKPCNHNKAVISGWKERHHRTEQILSEIHVHVLLFLSIMFYYKNIIANSALLYMYIVFELVH